MAVLTSPTELGLISASGNKLKGKDHVSFLNRNPAVKTAKEAWAQVVSDHMRNYYAQNNQGIRSVESIKRTGIQNILKWVPYSGDAKAEYLRLCASAK